MASSGDGDVVVSAVVGETVSATSFCPVGAGSGDGVAVRGSGDGVAGVVIGVTVAGPRMTMVDVVLSPDGEAAGTVAPSSGTSDGEVSTVAGVLIGVGMVTDGFIVVGVTIAGVSFVGVGRSPGKLAGGPKVVVGSTPVGGIVVGTPVVGTPVVEIAVSGAVSSGMLAGRPNVGPKPLVDGTGSDARAGVDDIITAAVPESASANAKRANDVVPFPLDAMSKTLRRTAPICGHKVANHHSV